MNDDEISAIKQRARNFVASIMNTTLGQNAHIPTDLQVFERLTSSGIQLTEEEYLTETASITDEDFEGWVQDAVQNLLDKQIPRNPLNLKKVEQPIDLVHRLGQESISAGKPSSFYLSLLEEIDKGLKIPLMNSRSMDTAQKRLDIALAYKEELTTVLEIAKNSAIRKNGEIFVDFAEAKQKFKIDCETSPAHISKDTVDDALRHHNLSSGAYSVMSRRKNKKKI